MGLVVGARLVVQSGLVGVGGGGGGGGCVFFSSRRRHTSSSTVCGLGDVYKRQGVTFAGIARSAPHQRAVVTGFAAVASPSPRSTEILSLIHI